MRHGETPTTGKVLPGRAPGLHLSGRGREQAERFAQRLAGVTVDAVLTSPLERTRETAAPTEARTGRQAVVDPGLLECDFGAVVCFSHADPIKAALAHALGTHLDLFQRIVVSPCSVSAIAYVPGQAPAVLTVNSTDEPLAGLRIS